LFHQMEALRHRHHCHVCLPRFFWDSLQEGFRPDRPLSLV
jgi:hypothetical protein